MRLHGLDAVEGLEPALGRFDIADRGLVVAARAGDGDSWEEIEGELLAIFELSKDAFAAGQPIVYVVYQPDLLGHGGPLGAMLATALLSGARALAMEDRAGMLAVNVVAYDEPVDADALARWVKTLLEQRSVTGEFIRLGRSHLGRLVP